MLPRPSTQLKTGWPGAYEYVVNGIKRFFTFMARTNADNLRAGDISTFVVDGLASVQ
jgi:hypothetical protein